MTGAQATTLLARIHRMQLDTQQWCHDHHDHACSCEPLREQYLATLERTVRRHTAHRGHDGYLTCVICTVCGDYRVQIPSRWPCDDINTVTTALNLMEQP
jgi:hypothetical protein